MRRRCRRSAVLVTALPGVSLDGPQTDADSGRRSGDRRGGRHCVPLASSPSSSSLPKPTSNTGCLHTSTAISRSSSRPGSAAVGGDPPPIADLKAQTSQLTEDNAERKALTSYYAPSSTSCHPSWNESPPNATSSSATSGPSPQLPASGAEPWTGKASNRGPARRAINATAPRGEVSLPDKKSRLPEGSCI
jgi:hypothetical protein